MGVTDPLFELHPFKRQQLPTSWIEIGWVSWPFRDKGSWISWAFGLDVLKLDVRWAVTHTGVV